jgi:hypothetical protein
VWVSSMEWSRKKRQLESKWEAVARGSRRKLALCTMFPRHPHQAWVMEEIESHCGKESSGEHCFISCVSEHCLYWASWSNFDCKSLHNLSFWEITSVLTFRS